MKITKVLFPFALIILLLIEGCSDKNSVKVFTNSDELVKEVEKNIKQITIQELKALMDKGESFILLDVRESDEHDAGYIPGSILMPRGVLEFRIAKNETWEAEGLYPPKKEDNIIIYCKLGHRGVLSAESLMKLGYTNVKALKGGWVDWNKAYPDKMEKIEKKDAPANTGTSDQKSTGC